MNNRLPDDTDNEFINNATCALVILMAILIAVILAGAPLKD